MARKKVEDLRQVNLQGAAHEVNTFVSGPRAPRSNSALELAAALKDAVEGIQDYQEREHRLDVEQATENKLYGGTVYANREPEALADYEQVRDSLDTMDKAQAYFLERTTPSGPFQDAHMKAGFEEAQLKGLGKFRGEHAKFLSEQKATTRTRDVFNDFYTFIDSQNTEFGPQTPASAFGRLGQIADNYGISKKDTNAIPLGVAEVLIAQGKFDKARGVLNYNRGPAGSLLSNSETAIDAKKLLNSITTEDSLGIANSIKDLEDTTLAGKQYTPVQRAKLDRLLEDGNVTIEKRNNLLAKNDEAVRVDGFSQTLADRLNTPGQSFMDPIPGATTEESAKAREKFSQDFYNATERKRAQGSIDPASYATRIARFSEQTNSTNAAVTQRLGVGYSAFNPAKIVADNEVDQQTIGSVAEYMMLYQQNPNVAAAHASNEATRKFYDDITLDVEFGTLPGDTNKRIELAVKNYANDAANPLKGTSELRVSDEEIVSAFETVTDAGWTLDKASNAVQWIPYIKRQVQDASRRTGNGDKSKLLNYVVKQIVSRSQRIGDYLVPMGTNTFIGKEQDLNALSKAAVDQYITENPTDGYKSDELVLVPIIGQQNMWGVSVKGSNQILKIIPQDQLPVTTKDKHSALSYDQPVKVGAVDKNLMNFIAGPESGGNYNVINGGSEKELTTMTVGEVLDFQKTMKGDGRESTAVGKYQIINKTLKGLVDDLNIPKTAKFDEAMQDRMALALLEKRGLSEYKSGKLTPKKFANNLSQEWASLPKDESGASYYEGVGSNKALVGFDQVIKLLTS